MRASAWPVEYSFACPWLIQFAAIPAHLCSLLDAALPRTLVLVRHYSSPVPLTTFKGLEALYEI